MLVFLSCVQVTSVTAVPFVLNELSNIEIVNEFDLSSLREIFSASASLASDVQAKIETKLKIKVHQGDFVKLIVF